MSRARRRKKQNAKESGKKTFKQDSNPHFTRYVDPEKDLHNDHMEKFYKDLGIVPEAEWPAFMESLRTPLHISFRVNGNRKAAQVVRERIKTYFSEAVMVGEREVQPPAVVSWYPSEEENCWAFAVSKKDFRRNDTLADFKRFLVQGGESGLLVRQELVSMIPPCLLDVRPEHSVLDMCAAPGSKTTQLVEFMNQGDEAPSGIVVANDLNPDRAYMIHHRLKPFFTANLMILAEDARNLPAIRTGADENYTGGERVLYDRVLADVPCSGDGTMRKALDMWKRWHPMMGAGIHRLQLEVARKGLAQLKAGGRFVYSTCSLNPHENEAVVAQLLRENEGSLRLVDVSDLLPGLVRVPGVNKWRFMDKKGEWIEDPAAVEQCPNTAMPPSDEEAARFHLERTFRILPHHQDTGGFYLAVLESVADPKEEAEGVAARAKKPPAKKSRRQPKSWEEPFFPLTPVLQERVAKALEFYGIKGLDVNRLRRRSETAKMIYYMGGLVHDALPSGDVGGITCVAAGTRVFKLHKLHEDCPYRIESDGCRVLAPMMTKQLIRINREDLINLLTEAHTVVLERLSEEARAGAEVAVPGSCVLHFVECDLFLPGWRGSQSVCHQIPKISLAFYQVLFDCAPPPPPKKRAKQDKEDKEQDEGKEEEEEAK